MLASIEHMAHVIGLYVERSADELGVTQAEAHVLAQLHRHGPTPIATLHLEFGHKRSTLTNILDRLEQRKLIRRELNNDDRRSFVVHLTPTGARAAGRVARMLDKLEHAVAAQLTSGDIRSIEAVAAALDAAVA
jgi:DNA-binding MarR family transcriptional regulator